jgi:hypothetical protein
MQNISLDAPPEGAINIEEFLAALSGPPQPSNWREAGLQMIGVAANSPDFQMGTTLAVDAATGEPVALLFIDEPEGETVIVGEFKPYGGTRYKFAIEQLSHFATRLSPAQFAGALTEDEKEAASARLREIEAAAQDNAALLGG